MSRDAASWRDEIALREASLADARREAAAGELSATSLAALVEREEAALGAAREALSRAEEREAQGAAAPARRPRRRRRLYLVVAGLCFAAAVGVLLTGALSARQPGDSSSGGITLDTAQRVAQLLSQAEADVAAGHAVDALSAYAAVLALEPRNLTALTQTGWLDFSAGSSAHDATLTREGVADLRRAIALAPTNPAPRLYYAIAAASTPGNDAVAIAQLKAFVRLSPSAAQRALAAPYLLKYHLKG